MSNLVAISFVLDTTDATVPLGFEAWIDNKKFYDTEHVQAKQKIQIEIVEDDAEHELCFVLKNKIQDHTKVDMVGNIISDARLVITDLDFDEIKLGHMVSEQAVYTHDQNAQLPTPVQAKFYSEMGCNGAVSLKFATPLYLWLLEHM
jgi:hypothetical protein